MVSIVVVGSVVVVDFVVVVVDSVVVGLVVVVVDSEVEEAREEVLLVVKSVLVETEVSKLLLLSVLNVIGVVDGNDVSDGEVEDDVEDDEELNVPVAVRTPSVVYVITPTPTQAAHKATLILMSAIFLTTLVSVLALKVSTRAGSQIKKKGKHATAVITHSTSNLVAAALPTPTVTRAACSLGCSAEDSLDIFGFNNSIQQKKDSLVFKYTLF